MKITKEEFIERKNKWIEDAKSKKGIIAQLDADGLSSAFILNKLTGLPVSGITDLYNNIHGIGKGDNLSDFVFVDVEVFDQNVLSTGNHNNVTNEEVLDELMKDRISSCLNPNYQFGTTVSDYTKKYPYSTSLYLMELYGEDLDIEAILSNEQIKDSLVFADGIYNNVWKYKANAKDWQTKLITNTNLNDLMLNPLFENQDRSAFERGLLERMTSHFNGFDPRTKFDRNNKNGETTSDFNQRKMECMLTPFVSSGLISNVDFNKKVTLESKKFGSRFYNAIPREYHCDPILIYENTFTINYIFQDTISLTTIPREDQYV